MKKLLYMGIGIMVGAATVALMYNAKPMSMCIKKCKTSMSNSLNEYMDELALLIEEMDEENVKQRLKNKYNTFKRKIEKIDFENLEENMKEMVNSLIEEIKELINQIKEKDLNTN